MGLGTSHWRIPSELHRNLGWKGPLRKPLVLPLASSKINIKFKAAFSETCASEFCISLRVEIAQPHWAACTIAWLFPW